MKLYRFYIGYTDRNGAIIPFDRMERALRAAFARFFPDAGYTNYNATGFWQGAAERTVVAEIIGQGSVYAMAAHLAEVLNQTCVLCVETDVAAALIDAEGKVSQI